MQFLFEWPTCEELRFYAKNRDAKLKENGENAGWQEGVCDNDEGYKSLRCTQYQKSSDELVLNGGELPVIIVT